MDEYEASVNGPASRLLSERTGSLAEAPAPEEKQHAAMAGFGLLLVDPCITQRPSPWSTEG
jgi:hypothetical protein